MEVKQTKNSGLLVGRLSEKNLEVVDDKYKDKDGKERPCKVIKGDIVIETTNGFFKLRVYSRNKKADNTDNKMYKGFETIVNTYISKLDATKDESKIADNLSCSVKVGCNDYVGQDGNIKKSTQITMFNANRVMGEVESSTDLDIEGVIRTIKPELDKSGEETERLIIEFVMIGYGGKAEPIELVVEKDLADDFNDTYKVGQTCEIYANMVMKHVGGENNKKEASFGRKAQTRSGFDVMEIVVIGGEAPYEDEEDDEGNSKVIDIKTMATLMKERDIELEAKVNEAKNGGTQKKESKGMGTKKPIDNDEIPF